jgi:hypothetical protein
MWERLEHRLALLELHETGELRWRKAQDDAFAFLSQLPWTRAAPRHKVCRLAPEHRDDVRRLLDRVWPGWTAEAEALQDAGLPPTPDGHARLADLRRAEALPPLPARVNRRSAAAATAAGAKAALTPGQAEALAGVELTDDGLARLRPPPGLRARRGDRVISLDELLVVFDEVGVSDRALRDGLRLDGEVEAVLLVENLGAWRDMPRPGRWLLAHVPGWNTALVRPLIGAIGDVPVVHFGDLDPNGVRIVEHLRGQLPGLRWLVPDWWEELRPLHAHRREWPADLDLSGAPPLVRRLAATGEWLEQERVALDPRLPEAMAAALRGSPGG